MRTTVTLEDDVAARLRQRARERDLPFKVVLNEALRAGLTEGGAPTDPYRMPTSSMRARPDVDLTKALALAGALEDAEVASRLEQGR